jgi:hypothetical protein
MKSFTSRQFREIYATLPERVRFRARKSYHLFKDDPSHPSLNFKKVGGTTDTYSARVGLGYRVLGLVEGEEIVWFWIGTHADYDKLI